MSSGPLPVKIEAVAYSGYKANERPLYFILGGKKYNVLSILDRWCEVESDHFKVLAEDDRIYLLKWHRALDSWFVVKAFERPGEP